MPRGGTQVKRVLLIEQHSLFRQVLALVLKWNTDFKESVEADSLAQALRILGNSNHKPDLAIVDLDLANSDELDLISELRASAPDVPVLVITLRPDVEQRERALRAGAGEVLPMAASPKEIVDVAKQLIRE
jgi:DNA-binding NarL/FixJ family response regulator